MGSVKREKKDREKIMGTSLTKYPLKSGIKVETLSRGEEKAYSRRI